MNICYDINRCCVTVSVFFFMQAEDGIRVATVTGFQTCALPISPLVAGDEGVSQSHGDDLADQDELRVQRSEEELRAGTREREAGSVKVRKRVTTDRERIEVPVKHEEVTVQRVPGS